MNLPVPPPDTKGLSPVVISFIRTSVPGAVSIAIVWTNHELARRGFVWVVPVDSATAAQAVTFVVGMAYYTLVRRLERWKPVLGWLLGYPAQPVY